MRPQSITLFERIIFGTLILGAIQSYLGWDRLVALAATAEANPVAFILTTQIFIFALIGTLTLLVSRRRSKVAMWTSIAMFALGLPLSFRTITNGLPLGSGVIMALQTIGQLVAYGLLFAPSSRHWMNREAQAD